MSELVYVEQVREGDGLFGSVVAARQEEGGRWTFTLTDGRRTLPMRSDHKVKVT